MADLSVAGAKITKMTSRKRRPGGTFDQPML